MFVPVIVPPSRTLSPRAQWLGQRIAELVRDARDQDPGLTVTDVRQALRLAARTVWTETDRDGPRVAAIVAVVLVLAGLAAALAVPPLGVSRILLAGVLGLAAAGVLVTLVSRRM